MKLISLTLENIKSYINETIVFFDGVNFVSGANGSGKTTIIEAIGYALFDATPFSSPGPNSSRWTHSKDPGLYTHSSIS